MISLEERIQKLESLFNSIINIVKTDIRVSLPAKVTSFDPQKQTISCIPTIRELVNQNGKVNFIDLPELKDVPIIMPRAGGWSITFPIKEGNECMVIFQDLCMDGWWFRGGIQNWNDLRRHDLSDAIAIFSPWSQPNTLSSYNTSGLELRSDDGLTKITITPKSIDIIGNVSITGNMNITGSVTSSQEVSASGIPLSTHKHVSSSAGQDTSLPKA